VRFLSTNVTDVKKNKYRKKFRFIANIWWICLLEVLKKSQCWSVKSWMEMNQQQMCVGISVQRNQFNFNYFLVNSKFVKKFCEQRMFFKDFKVGQKLRTWPLNIMTFSMTNVWSCENQIPKKYKQCFFSEWINGFITHLRNLENKEKVSERNEMVKRKQKILEKYKLFEV